MAVEENTKKSFSFKLNSKSGHSKVSLKEQDRLFVKGNDKDTEKDYILSAQGQELKR